jgi:L-lactate dehydrogenase complex protein LldE
VRVALFVTCVNDTLYPRTGQAAVTLLERLGVDVDFPADQTCCGQPQYNTGYRSQAVPLAGRYARTFAGYDYVVTPSGSCAAMVRDHHPELTGDGAAAGRTYELTEFLTDVLEVTDVGAYYPHTVTYHPTCHGLRLLRLGDRPMRLLQQVRGLELRELDGADECCGFGGTFALKNAEVSTAMGEDKIDNALSTGAEVICTSDSSCMMHLGGLLSRRKSVVRSMHLAEILATQDDGS